MDTTMANSNSIGALATVLASLATLNYTISGFIQSNTHHQPNIIYTGQAYVGYAVMAWLGAIFLAFGWTGAAYSLKKRHFGLAITGTFLIFASCIVETETLLYAPGMNVGVALTPLQSSAGIIILQVLSSLVGIFFTARSKQLFT
jgi:hypothetical protein